MGIHDRDYYQGTRGSSGIARLTGSAVLTILVINVVVWFIQVLTTPKMGSDPISTYWLSQCR